MVNSDCQTNVFDQNLNIVKILRWSTTVVNRWFYSSVRLFEWSWYHNWQDGVMIFICNIEYVIIFKWKILYYTYIIWYYCCSLFKGLFSRFSRRIYKAIFRLFFFWVEGVDKIYILILIYTKFRLKYFIKNMIKASIIMFSINIIKLSKNAIYFVISVFYSSWLLNLNTDKSTRNIRFEYFFLVLLQICGWMTTWRRRVSLW